MGNENQEPPIRDVVLFEDTGDPFDPRKNDDPPILNRVQLAPNVYIERLPAPLNRHVKSACAFRGYNWEIHMDTVPTLYAFVRETNDTGEWDDDSGYRRPLRSRGYAIRHRSVWNSPGACSRQAFVTAPTTSFNRP